MWNCVRGSPDTLVHFEGMSWDRGVNQQVTVVPHHPPGVCFTTRLFRVQKKGEDKDFVQEVTFPSLQVHAVPNCCCLMHSQGRWQGPRGVSDWSLGFLTVNVMGRMY